MTRMTVLNIKDRIDQSKFTLASPVKEEDGTRTMGISYDNKPFTFKTPRLKFNKETGILYFNMVNKPIFSEFLNNLEDTIVSSLNSDSKRLFNGRSFSKDHMRSSMQTFWDVSEDPLAKITPYLFDPTKITCIDAFGEPGLYDDIRSNVSALIEVKNLVFSNNLFKTRLDFKQLKMSRFEATPIDQWDNAIIEKPAAVVEEQESTQPTLEEDTGDFFID